MKTPGYSAAISYPMFSALSAAYAFEFIATFLSGLYTGLKVVEYRELGGKVSLDGIRMMLPSNGGGYKRQR